LRTVDQRGPFFTVDERRRTSIDLVEADIPFSQGSFNTVELPGPAPGPVRSDPQDVDIALQVQVGMPAAGTPERDVDTGHSHPLEPLGVERRDVHQQKGNSKAQGPEVIPDVAVPEHPVAE